MAVVALLWPLFLYQNAAVLYLNVDIASYFANFGKLPKSHGGFGAPSRIQKKFQFGKVGSKSTFCHKSKPQTVRLGENKRHPFCFSSTNPKTHNRKVNQNHKTKDGLLVVRSLVVDVCSEMQIQVSIIWGGTFVM